MEIALYTITSGLHSEVMENVLQEQFIQDIQSRLGSEIVFRGSDFSDYGSHDRDLVYVRTGGTEGIFKSLDLPGYIRLLTSGKSNSLAASMEIMSYLRMNSRSGEIIHGDADYIVERILAGESEAEEDFPLIGPLPAVDFCGARLGVIGKPSDWLISSDVDYVKAKSRLGLELVDIPISELLEEVKDFKGDMRTFEGSEEIYRALLSLVQRYRLSGLTLRCFDLLDTLHNTGCLAMAKLNAMGVPASCEGDIPALISMMIARKLTGFAGFQCNLSRVEGDELLFAHCTVPLNMVSSYRYDTHFESGIGTAIKGELPPGPVTVFKVSPDLEHMVAVPGTILRNLSEPCLCRTQILVNVPDSRKYFLTSPLANHHVIVPGSLGI
ncbi:MAG: hypothetical protein Q4G10_04635 [Bacteroidia bacterium]|nr:hypothetical protein [Bacteroidia bacterium]